MCFFFASSKSCAFAHHGVFMYTIPRTLLLALPVIYELHRVFISEPRARLDGDKSTAVRIKPEPDRETNALLISILLQIHPAGTRSSWGAGGGGLGSTGCNNLTDDRKVQGTFRTHTAPRATRCKSSVRLGNVLGVIYRCGNRVVYASVMTRERSRRKCGMNRAEPQRESNIPMDCNFFVEQPDSGATV